MTEVEDDIDLTAGSRQVVATRSEHEQVRVATTCSTAATGRIAARGAMASTPSAAAPATIRFTAMPTPTGCTARRGMTAWMAGRARISWPAAAATTSLRVEHRPNDVVREAIER